MKVLHLVLILFWLYTVNLAAGALLATRIPLFSLAKTVVVGLGVLILFFVEHFYGLGSLQLWFAVLFLLSCAILIWRRHHIQRWAWSDHAFIIGFAYAFFWRFLLPDVNTSTENITDLYFISTFVPGQTLPADNLWLAPYKFDFYYGLQHYAAALLARTLHVGPGYAYTLGFALVFGYVASLIWESTYAHTKSKVFAYCLMAAVLVGGTGISPLLHFIKAASFDHSPVVAAMRFAGNVEEQTLLANWLQSPGREVQHIPLESFGYTLFVSDYHPPLASYLILCMFLSALWLWSKVRVSGTASNRDDSHSGNRWYVAIMTLCLPLTLIGNTWVFPLMALVFVGWLVYCYQGRIAIDWPIVLAAFAGGFFLIYPFLSYFTQNSLSTASIRITPSAQYTPLTILLLQFWPALLIGALLFLARGKIRELAWFVALCFFALLAVSELLYVEDGSVGIYNRTNTGMKWWGWIYLFVFIPGAWLVYENRVLWQRGLLYLALIAPTLAQGYYMGSHLWTSGKPNVGHLEGHAWLTKNSPMADVLTYLQSAPHGVVLENVAKDFYTEAPALSMFAVKPVFIGWPHHLIGWGKSPGIVMKRYEEHRNFYNGDMENPAEWLKKNQIRYVVWSTRESDKRAFDRLQAALAQDYFWREFGTVAGNPTRVGVWVHK